MQVEIEHRPSYALAVVSLDTGEGVQAEAGAMVSMSETIATTWARPAAGSRRSIGGEGLVCKLGGPGRFFMQTRSPESFLAWLIPKLPTQRE